MTTVAFDLPDQLAQEARRAGLLSSEQVEQWLRRQLRTKSFEQLKQAMERMSATDEPPYMSPEEIAQEIASMRTERRASGAR